MDHMLSFQRGMALPTFPDNDDNLTSNIVGGAGGGREQGEGEVEGEGAVRDREAITPRMHYSNSVDKYRSTSSAKKRKVKDSPCQFCVENVNGLELVNHLKKEEKCKHLYLRCFRVNSVDALLLKMFSCTVCFIQKQVDFKKHLLRNENCLKEYQRKMNEKDVMKIHKKILAQKRAALPSRSRTARGLEFAKEKLIHKDAKMNMTVADSLNEFRASITFANYKKCVVCYSNFGHFSARELKKDEKWFEELELDSIPKQSLRRLENFFICNNCDKSANNNVEEESKESEAVCLGEVADGVKITFLPLKHAPKSGAEPVEENKITIAFPKNCAALDTIQDLEKVRGRAATIPKLYKTENIERSTISALYENEANKYKNIKLNEDKYMAFVRDFKNKKLSRVEKLENSDSGRVTCSSDWFRHLCDEMKHRVDQFGSIFLTCKLDLPQTSPEVVATCLIQEGFAVSVDKKGSANGELKTSYLIHLDHMSDEDCSNDCLNRMDLEEYLQKELFNKDSIGNKHMGTYVSAVHQKLLAFVKCIILAPASGLFSENHYLMLLFDSDGKASIVGCIWPSALDEINLNVAESKGQLTKISELKGFVETNLVATTDSRLLRATFNLSEVEAEHLSQLVHDNQLHICNDQTCLLCSSVELPSLETLVKHCCFGKNNENVKRFRKLMMKRLKAMSLEKKRTLSTFAWLEEEWESVTGAISESFESVIISFEAEQEDLLFEIDDRLAMQLDEYTLSPLTAVYHYIISCGSKQDLSKVVFKRLRIVDCFVQPFNHLFLKSCNSSIEVKVVDNTLLFEKFVSDHNFENGEQPELAFSHRLVSLGEAVSLMDKTKKRMKSSTIVEFLNAKPFRKFVMKKVFVESENNFTLDDGSDDKFQIVSNNISRHFQRINGQELVLSETASWFDFVGAAKSKEISQTYLNSEIPLSDVKSANSDGYLPTFIICSNGDVLKKRASQKILVLPKLRTNHARMYSRCLLFLPLRNEDELLEPNLREKYLDLMEDGSRTVVDYVESKIFKMKVAWNQEDVEEEGIRDGDIGDGVIGGEEGIRDGDIGDGVIGGEGETEDMGAGLEDDEMLDYLLEALEN